MSNANTDRDVILDRLRAANTEGLLSVSAIDSLGHIAWIVATHGGNLQSFADSYDSADRCAPQGARMALGTLVDLVVAGTDDARSVAAVLALACVGDSYAEREVAGRFLSAVNRIRIAALLPARLSSLADAVRRGKYTSAQIKLARTIAKERGVSLLSFAGAA